MKRQRPSSFNNKTHIMVKCTFETNTNISYFDRNTAIEKWFGATIKLIVERAYACVMHIIYVPTSLYSSDAY